MVELEAGFGCPGCAQLCLEAEKMLSEAETGDRGKLEGADMSTTCGEWSSGPEEGSCSPNHEVLVVCRNRYIN